MGNTSSETNLVDPLLLQSTTETSTSNTMESKAMLVVENSTDSGIIAAQPNHAVATSSSFQSIQQSSSIQSTENSKLEASPPQVNQAESADKKNKSDSSPMDNRTEIGIRCAQPNQAATPSSSPPAKHSIDMHTVNLAGNPPLDSSAAPANQPTEDKNYSSPMDNKPDSTAKPRKDTPQDVVQQEIQTATIQAMETPHHPTVSAISESETTTGLAVYSETASDTGNSNQQPSLTTLERIARTRNPVDRFQPVFETARDDEPEEAQTVPKGKDLSLVNYKSMAVMQYQGDKLIATFPSMRQATTATQIPRQGIAACCHGKREQVGGYTWKFQASIKPVEQWDGEHLVATFKSEKDAANEAGVEPWKMSQACLQKLPGPNGFTWKYAKVSLSTKATTKASKNEADKSTANTQQSPPVSSLLQENPSVRARTEIPVDGDKSVSTTPSMTKNRPPSWASMKQVEQWDGERLVATFRSMKDAAEEAGVKTWKMSKACRQSSPGPNGFTWKYTNASLSTSATTKGTKNEVKDSIDNTQERPPVSPPSNANDSVRARTETPVDVGTLVSTFPSLKKNRSASEAIMKQVEQWDGERLVATFPSVKNAADEAGVELWKMSKACRLDSPGPNGFTWKYAKASFSTNATPKKAEESTEHTQPSPPVSSPSRTNHSVRARPVFQLDGDNIVSTFPSLTEAAKAFGIDRKLISACCNGKCQKAGGYTWKFVDQGRQPTAVQSRGRQPSRTRASCDDSPLQQEARSRKRDRAVMQYEDGKFIASFPSMTAAGDAVNHSRHDIKNCCNGKRQRVGGYTWRFADQSKDEEHTIPPSSGTKADCELPHDELEETETVSDDENPSLFSYVSMAVTQYKGDKLIAAFESIRQAEIATNVARRYIAACCHGNQEQAGGYTWKFQGQPRPHSWASMKQVEQWDGERLVATFRSMKDAANEAGVKPWAMTSACKQDSPGPNGFTWRYANASFSRTSTTKTSGNEAEESTETTQQSPQGSSRSKANLPGNARAVIQLDGENIVSTFQSLTEAATALDIDRYHISACCNGKRQDAGGYTWKFVNHGQQRTVARSRGHPQPSRTRASCDSTQQQEVPSRKRRHEVMQYKDGQYVTTMPSMTATAPGRMSRQQDKEENSQENQVFRPRNMTQVNACKAVAQFDGDRKVAVFKSMTEAATAVGSYRHAIAACCKGNRETAGGYFWRFLNEPTAKIQSRPSVGEWQLSEQKTRFDDVEAEGKQTSSKTLPSGTSSTTSSKSVVQLDGDKAIATFTSLTAAAKTVNTSRQEIAKCCNGKREHAGGFSWRFAGKLQDDANALHKHSLEHKTHQKAESNTKEVEQWDGTHLVAIFESVLEAAEAAGAGPDEMRAACEQDDRLGPAEFMWRYAKHSSAKASRPEDDAGKLKAGKEGIVDSLQLNTKAAAKTKALSTSNRGAEVRRKSVEQWKDNCFVAKFPSIAQAAKTVGISQGCIAKACRGGRPDYNGYTWKFSRVPSMHRSSSQTKAKKVEKWDGDRLLETFDSMTQAAKDAGVWKSKMSFWCRHGLPGPDGFMWKYAERSATTPKVVAVEKDGSFIPTGRPDRDSTNAGNQNGFTKTVGASLSGSKVEEAIANHVRSALGDFEVFLCRFTDAAPLGMDIWSSTCSSELHNAMQSAQLKVTRSSELWGNDCIVGSVARDGQSEQAGIKTADCLMLLHDGELYSDFGVVLAACKHRPLTFVVIRDHGTTFGAANLDLDTLDQEADGMDDLAQLLNIDDRHPIIAAGNVDMQATQPSFQVFECSIHDPYMGIAGDASRSDHAK